MLKIKKMQNVFLVLLIVVSKTITAQPPVFEGAKKINVAIFAPLYLDSLFGAKGYKHGTEIPKFAQPSIDYIQGALIALDSLQQSNTTIDAKIIDTKSYSQPLATQIKNGRFDSTDILIGSVRDADYKQLADLANANNIPFVSATLPNDGGVSNNPFLIIMNTTLKAHIEGIFSYLVQEHSTDKIYICRKSGASEDRIPNILKQLNEQEGHPMLNIKVLEDSAAFNYETLNEQLDSNRKTVFIGATLDEKFAYDIASTCKALDETYHIKLIGMPNWDGFALFKKKDEKLKDYPVFYTTPYFNNKIDEYSKVLQTAYNKKYKTKPSDMAFKGFENVWMFCSLLLKHQTDLMSNLNDKTAKVICDYNFKPVKLKKENITPDYFENKHVYFIKILNGAMSKAW